MSDSERPKCGLCGEPMPEGEEMFQYHGHSGPCPRHVFIPQHVTTSAMSEAAKRMSEDLAIASAACEAGMVDEQGKLRDFTTASCNTTGVWEQSMLVSGECKVVYFIVPRSAAEAAKESQ